MGRVLLYGTRNVHLLVWIQAVIAKWAALHFCGYLQQIWVLCSCVQLWIFIFWLGVLIHWRHECCVITGILCFSLAGEEAVCFWTSSAIKNCNWYSMTWWTKPPSAACKAAGINCKWHKPRHLLYYNWLYCFIISRLYCFKMKLGKACLDEHSLIFGSHVWAVLASLVLPKSMAGLCFFNSDALTWCQVFLFQICNCSASFWSSNNKDSEEEMGQNNLSGNNVISHSL